MLGGACMAILTFILLAMHVAVVGATWPTLLVAWLFVGLGYSAILTPSGRLLKRSSHPEDRPALFAAQFAMSHVCWLLAYPFAGWLMTEFGPLPALASLAALAGGGVLAGLRFWPADDHQQVAHEHPELPTDHPHLTGHRHHVHDFIIDDIHPSWGRGI